MKKPKVSIITPCLNSEATIRQTIESVLHQTYGNIEYIIIDGKSTDKTLDIVREYIPQFQGRLKYVSEKDKGIYDAMNKGIRQSTGTLIGIIGSDDYYECDAVEKIVAHMTDEPYQVLYGYCRVYHKNRVKYIAKKRHETLPQTMIPHATCFVTRQIYRDFGMFVTAFKVASDYELMLRLYSSKQVTFIQIQEILADFRKGGASSVKRCFVENILIQRYHKVISTKDMIKKLINLYL